MEPRDARVGQPGPALRGPAERRQHAVDRPADRADRRVVDQLQRDGRRSGGPGPRRRGGQRVEGPVQPLAGRAVEPGDADPIGADLDRPAAADPARATRRAAPAEGRTAAEVEAERGAGDHLDGEVPAADQPGGRARGRRGGRGRRRRRAGRTGAPTAHARPGPQTSSRSGPSLPAASQNRCKARSIKAVRPAGGRWTWRGDPSDHATSAPADPSPRRGDRAGPGERAVGIRHGDGRVRSGPGRRRRATGRCRSGCRSCSCPGGGGR